MTTLHLRNVTASAPAAIQQTSYSWLAMRAADSSRPAQSQGLTPSAQDDLRKTAIAGKASVPVTPLAARDASKAPLLAGADADERVSRR
jgi:hypothetical protein